MYGMSTVPAEGRVLGGWWVGAARAPLLVGRRRAGGRGASDGSAPREPHASCHVPSEAVLQRSTGATLDSRVLYVRSYVHLSTRQVVPVATAVRTLASTYLPVGT
eukprot:SAG31_NODE_1611_length_7748_cov_2.128758_9_plen_105_part_00